MLKEKLKDEGKEVQPVPEEGEENAKVGGGEDDEEDLINELHDLREFVNNNKECIEEFFNIKRDKKAQESSENSEQDDDDEEMGGEKETPH